jgi:site-specific recombinase
MLALGVASLGARTVGRWPLIMAAFGIACIFVLNLTTSFYLALRLALHAQDVTGRDHREIIRTLWSHFLHSPRDFFIPPPEDAPTTPPPSPTTNTTEPAV